MRKIIIFLIILFLGLSLYGVWKWKTNIYSKEILKLEILGPENADFLEEIEYLVKIKNNGNIVLENPKLIFEYPEMSVLEDGKSQREELDSEEIGEAIYPGEEKSFSFKTKLMGSEKDVKTAKAWLSYYPKNLRVPYESATTFTTRLKSAPITFEFDLPSKIISGKEIEFYLNYFSNCDYPLLNLRIFVVYPFNFEFISAQPRGLEENEWILPPLNKAQGGRIKIRGRFIGEIGEQKVIKAQLGIWQNENYTLLKETNKAIEINKPALYITQQINGIPGYTANPGDFLHYEIFFKNIGEEPLTNLSLLTILEGEFFDLETVKAPEGDLAVGDNSVIWDWKKIPVLKFLESQEENKVEFWVRLKNELEIKGNGNKSPEIRTKIFLGQAKEEFVNKVNSKLIVSQKAYFNNEIFGNSGPFPLQVGQDTTFTITWEAKNYYNNVNNVKIKATLPQEVQLTGKIFPEDAKLTFDSQSKEIIWEIGTLKAGQGILNQPPSFSFQVLFHPRQNQEKLENSIIISEAKIVGEDEFTGQILENKTNLIDVGLIKN